MLPALVTTETERDARHAKLGHTNCKYWRVAEQTQQWQHCQQKIRDLCLDRPDFNPCFSGDLDHDLTGEELGDDFQVVGNTSAVYNFKLALNEGLLVKSAKFVAWSDGWLLSQANHFLCTDMYGQWTSPA